MSVVAHLDLLSVRHDELEQKIQQAYHHHDPDNKIGFLKKRKLRIKDEIVKLRRLKESAY